MNNEKFNYGHDFFQYINEQATAKVLFVTDPQISRIDLVCENISVDDVISRIEVIVPQEMIYVIFNLISNGCNYWTALKISQNDVF